VHTSTCTQAIVPVASLKTYTEPATTATATCWRMNAQFNDHALEQPQGVVQRCVALPGRCGATPCSPPGHGRQTTQTAPGPDPRGAPVRTMRPDFLLFYHQDRHQRAYGSHTRPAYPQSAVHVVVSSSTCRWCWLGDQTQGRTFRTYLIMHRNTYDIPVLFYSAPCHRRS
jgi:hypothetical protein